VEYSIIRGFFRPLKVRGEILETVNITKREGRRVEKTVMLQRSIAFAEKRAPIMKFRGVEGKLQWGGYGSRGEWGAGNFKKLFDTSTKKKRRRCFVREMSPRVQGKTNCAMEKSGCPRMRDEDDGRKHNDA